MVGLFSDTIRAFWGIMLDSGVWLLAGLALAGIVHAFVPPGFLARHLASKGPDGSGPRGAVWPIMKASLLGIPLPLCSCSVIPVAAGLRRAGAGRGASAAFAISTPQTGEESVPLTWALFGPVFALTRPVVAVVTGLVAGLLIEVFGTPREPAGTAATPSDKGGTPCCADVPLSIEQPRQAETKEEAGSCCCGTTAAAAPEPSCCGSNASPAGPHGFGARTKSAIRHGFVTMLLDLAPWLAVGLVASALIAAAVPQGWIADNIGTGLAPMLLMLVVGLPLYVCATSTTPLAFTLVAAGLSPGAALVLLLSGPASNTATMAWVIKDLGVRALAIYLAVIAVLAVATGLLFDSFLAGAVRLADHAHTHDHAAVGIVQSFGAGLFTAMLAIAVLVRLLRFSRGSRSRDAGDTLSIVGQ